MKNIYSIIIFVMLIISCNKKKFFAGPSYFIDDFETYNMLQNLLLPHDTLWSFTQLTRTDNNITVDSTQSHSGKKSLKFTAKKSDDEGASKCSIAKHNMAFWDGETMRVSAWYYIKDTLPTEWLFLLDLEEQTAIGAGPGIRIALLNNQLRMEYKFLENDIVQKVGQEVNFPRNEWVEVIWEVKLSQQHKGTVKLWQNGQLIIDSKGNRTLPKDLLYSQQGTKGMYSSIEIGITANSANNDLTLWVDDIMFEKK
ncbi:MAG: heparin lyase I family protein [Bacteroidota bacterium]|nr:heparin lyase I family protein [Bacteroidota bacterium]